MHFANGRKAKVGDLVVGYGYNTTVPPYPQKDEAFEMKKLVGTLVKAVPGSDTCNAEIEWIELMASDGSTVPHFTRPRMAQGGDPRMYVTPDGSVNAHFVCRDYTHVGALLHVEDVIALAGDEKRPGHKVAAVAARPAFRIDADTGKVSRLADEHLPDSLLNLNERGIASYPPKTCSCNIAHDGACPSAEATHHKA